MSTGNDDFFVGYSARPPVPLRKFLGALAAVLTAGSGILALIIGLNQGDAGSGGFDWDAGQQNIAGVIETKPYPIIHAGPSKAFPAGHTYLLSGDGKRGAPTEGQVIDGSAIEASGFVVKRGALDMMIVDDGKNLKTSTAANNQRPPTPIDLGRWRVRGEICDGKCYAGAMRPGAGLAHKACANLCLTGGVPPILVTASPIAGATFFLLSDIDGLALDQRVLDHVAVQIDIEGRVERRGDMHVFKLDPATLKVRR